MSFDAGLYSLFVYLTLFYLAVFVVSSCAIHGARTVSDLGLMFDCFIFPERTFAMLWKKTV
jgi:hypothetical protein